MKVNGTAVIYADNVNHMNASIRSMSPNMGEINQRLGKLEPMLTNID